MSPPNPTPVCVYIHVTPQTQRIKLHLPTPPAATPVEPAQLPGQGVRGLKAAAPACHAPAATAGAPHRSGSRVTALQAARPHCAASQGRGFPLRAPLCHLKRNVALKYKLRCSLSCFGQLKAAWQAGAGGRLRHLSCCGMEPLRLIYFFLRKKIRQVTVVTVPGSATPAVAPWQTCCVASRQSARGGPGLRSCS